MTKPETESYAYGPDEETFTGDGCASREDAIREGIAELDLEVGDWLYTGIARRPPIERFVPDAEHVIEYMREAVSENHGDYSESWLATVTPEAERELNEALEKTVREWCERHGHAISFFEVDAVESHQVTAEMLGDKP